LVEKASETGPDEYHVLSQNTRADTVYHINQTTENK